MYKRIKYKYEEKQYLVLRYIDSLANGATYTEIIKYAYELSHGKDTFDKYKNRGYWSGIFRKKNSFNLRIKRERDPWYIEGNRWYIDDGWATILLKKNDKNNYVLNLEGQQKLTYLIEKFNG